MSELDNSHKQAGSDIEQAVLVWERKQIPGVQNHHPACSTGQGRRARTAGTRPAVQAEPHVLARLSGESWLSQRNYQRTG